MMVCNFNYFYSNFKLQILKNPEVSCKLKFQRISYQIEECLHCITLFTFYMFCWGQALMNMHAWKFRSELCLILLFVGKGYKYKGSGGSDLCVHMLGTGVLAVLPSGQSLEAQVRSRSGQGMAGCLNGSDPRTGIESRSQS